MGTTVVVVTHAREIVDQFAKRVVAIDGGTVISDQTGGYYVRPDVTRLTEEALQQAAPAHRRKAPEAPQAPSSAAQQEKAPEAGQQSPSPAEAGQPELQELLDELELLPQLRMKSDRQEVRK